jgi:Uma2 family endonuclease
MSSPPTPVAPVPPAPGSEWVLGPEDIPDLDALVTEDEAPVDSIFTEKQQRLLTEVLYSSWPGPGGDRKFLALANVGLFNVSAQPPLVPDCMLSLDVSAAEDLRAKENRSYFRWVIGKGPEVVIEIVSDRRGGEDTLKKQQYANVGVLFYVIFDPDNLLGGGVLRAYVLERGKYVPIDPGWFEEVGLGLTLWTGRYEGAQGTWLRWCDRGGNVVPTGAERADRLAAQLRALGVDPQA